MIRVGVKRVKGVMPQVVVPKDIGPRVERALKAGGDELLKWSKLLCPRDTEALVNSGRVLSTGSGINTVVYVGYGGYDLPAVLAFSQHHEKRHVVRVPSLYARWQHD